MRSKIPIPKDVLWHLKFKERGAKFMRSKMPIPKDILWHLKFKERGQNL